MKHRIIDELMLKREHFPMKGQWFVDVFPPAHPSILENKIDLDLAYDCLEEALELTAEDIKTIPSDVIELYPVGDNFPVKDINVISDWIRTKQEGKIDVKKYNDGIDIVEFPINGNFEITDTHFGYKVAQDLRCKEGGYWNTGLKLPQPVMEEYELKAGDDGRINEYKAIWSPHNLDTPMQRIFCKNLAIVYDNAVVKRKYGVK